MANLTPNEYFKIEGPIRSSRLRYQETDSFDDKTGKDIPASVDFVGQNDRVIFLSMNKKGEVRIMTFKIVNKEGTITKPEDVIDSIKNDSDFPGADITDYVKKILGKKYEDILTEDPTKADQFITKHVTNYNGVSKAFFVKNIEIIQTPWDPNVVPTQPTGPPPVENKIVTTTEPMVATSSVGPSASNVDDSNVGASASNVGATASNIVGEFTFNVEQDNTFIGVNNQFGTLYTIGIGEIKEEPIDKPEEGELLPEEGLDEEYSEEVYQGEAEIDPDISAVNQYVAMQILNDAEESRDTTEADKTFTSTGETISGKLNTTPDKGKGFGIIGKKMADKDLLKAMVDYIEGGYYYPGHAYSQFNEKSRNLYGSSGETLWGIDRHAGQTENTTLGKKFWAAVDNLSGYGSSTGTTGYSKKTNTRSWNNGSYPTKSGAWKYNYMPSKKDSGYDTMYNSFVEYASSHCHEWLDKYFKNHPVKAMILGDARMKFMWFRATWNGPGWFSWYVNGKKGSSATTGLKWAYDNVSKNVDDLILWDLNNRLKFGNSLITHDVKKMAKLIGIKG